VGPAPQPVPVNNLGHQADLQGRQRRDALVVSRQGDPQRLGQPDLAHQADRLQRRDHALGDVRVEERRVG
jgi:hypothetical protein